MTLPIAPSPGTGTGRCNDEVQIEDIRNTYINPIVSNPYPGNKRRRTPPRPTAYTLIPTKWIKVK